MSAINIQEYLAEQLYNLIKIDEKYKRYWNKHHCYKCNVEEYNCLKKCRHCKNYF